MNHKFENGTLISGGEPAPFDPSDPIHSFWHLKISKAYPPRDYWNTSAQHALRELVATTRPISVDEIGKHLESFVPNRLSDLGLDITDWDEEIKQAKRDSAKQEWEAIKAQILKSLHLLSD